MALRGERHDARSFQRQIPISSPHLADSEGLEEHETRRVHVRQLVAAQALERLDDGGVMVRVEGQQGEPRKLGEGDAKNAGGVLAEAMQEPAIGPPTRPQATNTSVVGCLRRGEPRLGDSGRSGPEMR